MRTALPCLIGLGIVVGCSSSAGTSPTADSDSGAATGADGGGGSSGGSGSSGGAASSSGSSGDGAAGTGTGLDASSGQRDAAGGGSEASTTASGDSGAFPPAGNPDGSCATFTLPTETHLVDTSSPTTVVGTGTPASCTFGALSSAVTKGGIITFDCGPDPVTIPVTATLTPPTSNAYATPTPPSLTIVIDGGNKVTLDGGKSVRILSWVHRGSWQKNKDTLTLQRIRLINGKTTPTESIPACAPSGSISNTACSTGYDDGQGGAVYMQDGSLRVIDSIFEHNQAALLGPDTGGGAIYLYGSGIPSYIMHSSFLDNTASNAGGVGMLWAGAFIINSLFEGNSAVGTGANSVDATMCTCSNMGNSNQIGSGGNGGAIYKDGGDGANLTICGTEIKGNSSNEFGPAVFLTADGSGAKLVIDDCNFTQNSSGNPVWQWCPGVSTDNPHGSSSTSSPSPINTTFCNASGASCTMTCSS